MAFRPASPEGSLLPVSWHLTVGETAFFAPAGVILGAVVSYFAVRKSARDNLVAQQKTIEANREIAALTTQTNLRIAEEERKRDEDRERRAHQKEPYEAVALALESFASDLQEQLWFFRLARDRKWDDFESEGRQKQLTSDWHEFWNKFRQTHETVRTKLLTTASDELNHLRYYFRTAETVFQDYGPSGDLKQNPKKWLSEFFVDRSDNVLGKTYRYGEFSPVDTLNSYIDSFDMMHDLVFWGMERIRYELGVSTDEPTRPYEGYGEGPESEE